MMMQSPYYAPSHPDQSRPSLGFPLGATLLFIVIFILSGIFSCCYHWDNIRFQNPPLDQVDNYNGSPSKHESKQRDGKQKQNESLPVLMPGDQIAKFIAMPCPCTPPRDHKMTVEVEKSIKQPQQIAVPLY